MMSFGYKKVPPPTDTEMKNFDPVVDYKPPPKPFDGKDDAKEKRNKAKETRISIAMIVLTFLASVCVLFGTLFPELSRGEVDMRPFRDILASAARQQAFLIRDRITLVNLGLWRYCYDDQLYDLVEIINPTMQFNRRSVRETAEEFEIEELEAEHSVQKRQSSSRQGDISIRCHSIPEPWKMPYFVKKKTDATKVLLIIGVVACILSFLNSILVLITRFPGLKFLQLFLCFLGAAIISSALGIAMTMQEEAEEYFNESIGRQMEDTFRDEMNLDLPAMGINLVGLRIVKMETGISGIFLGLSDVVIISTVILAEVARHM